MENEEMYIDTEDNSVIVQSPTVQEQEAPSAGEVVDQAFAQAEYLTVKHDEEMQSEIVRGAKEVARNRSIEITAKAEMKAKEAHFKNNKSACECFGYNETSTEKWAVSAMGIWHNIITAVWIILGMLTFAPVTFIARKLGVLIKTAWVAVVVAIGIYAFVALSPFWIKLIAMINGA